MKVTIISAGKLKEKYWREAVEEYSKRLLKYCSLEIIEIEDEKTPENPSDRECSLIKEKEGDRIRKHLKSNAAVISLAIKGKKMDSPGLAACIDTYGIQGKSHIQFVIGGSLGLHDSILRESDLLLSFSDMTFPHQLMRVVLLEQIYRSFRINRGEPYHK